MGRLLKQRYTRGGRTLRTRVWYCEFRDHTGRTVRESTGCRDRAAAQQVLASRERDAERVRSGLLPAGAIDARRPLADLHAEFVTHLTHSGRSTRHVDNAREFLPRIFAACGWSTFADVSDADVLRWATAERDRVSPATVNTHLAPLKTFSRWAADRCGGGADPLRRVKLLNPDVGSTRNKHTPTVADLAAVVTAAERAPRRRPAMPGTDRAMLYRVAAYTGFRAGELASLTPESFTWAGGMVVSVRIAAEHAKDRRAASVPIPAHVAEVLSPWLASRPAGLPCWPGKWARARDQSAWLERDCRRAGVRRFTFHALRSFYITELIRSGANVAEFRELARHASAQMSLDHYARVREGDTSTAVDRLPSLPPCLPACLPALAENDGKTRSQTDKKPPASRGRKSAGK